MLALSAFRETEIVEKMCSDIGAALLGSTCDVKGCQGQMVSATWLRVSVHMRITCIAQCCPSAKLLSQGSVYWCTSYTLWGGRWSGRWCIRVRTWSPALYAKLPWRLTVLCVFLPSAWVRIVSWLHWNGPGFQPERFAAGILTQSVVQKVTGAMTLLGASRC